jgi:hypothetical protein
MFADIIHTHNAKIMRAFQAIILKLVRNKFALVLRTML